MNKSFKTFFKFLSVLIILGGVYFGGYLVGHRNIEFEKNLIPKIVNTELAKPSEVDFSLFWNSWNIVKSKFIGQIDAQKMIYGAISGMVESLGDPYSLFLNPDEAKKFSEDLKGSFEGIGAELEIKDGQLLVVAPLERSPAEKAGLMAQDVIVKIDSVLVSEITFREAVNKIRGAKGTEVVLTIVRSGVNDPKEIKVKRAIITVESVRWEQKDNITYIKVRQFGDDTVGLFKKAADFANEKNSQAVLVDLRNNPGGYLYAAVDVASLFIDKGTIVIEEKKGKQQEEIKTTLLPKLKDKKLAILVNGGSASASEILAGAIQDYSRGTLIGAKTFGKGSVQNLESLQDGSEVRITIAKWLTPKGRAIDKEGIKPDIEIKISEDDLKSGRDPQLDRAIEELKK